MEENKFNNIPNNSRNIENNNEKKGRGLFYFVIAFAIIIISVVGATYAYFTASTTTGAGNEVTAGSSSLTLGLETDSSGLKDNLIPVSDNIVKYAYAEQKENTYEQGLCKTYAVDDEGNPEYELEEDGYTPKEDALGNPIQKCAVKKPDPNSTCIDDSGTEICSYYSFSVINNNSSEQTLSMYLGTNNNSFENLWFMVYTETENGDGQTVRTRVTDPKPVKKDTDTDKEVKFTVRTDKAEEEQFRLLANPKLQTLNSRVTYTVVLWIKELQDDGIEGNDDQTTIDGNKNFNGYIRVTSGDGAGVTGVISQANNYDDIATPTE